jgi:hypothetical protein
MPFRVLPHLLLSLSGAFGETPLFFGVAPPAFGGFSVLFGLLRLCFCVLAAWLIGGHGLPLLRTQARPGPMRTSEDVVLMDRPVFPYFVSFHVL